MGKANHLPLEKAKQPLMEKANHLPLEKAKQPLMEKANHLPLEKAKQALMRKANHLPLVENAHLEEIGLLSRENVNECRLLLTAKVKRKSGPVLSAARLIVDLVKNRSNAKNVIIGHLTTVQMVAITSFAPIAKLMMMMSRA